MKRNLSLLIVSTFLINTLWPEEALASVQDALRPPSGIETAKELHSALDGGEGKEFLSGKAHVSVVVHRRPQGMEITFNRKERYFIPESVIFIIPSSAPIPQSILDSFGVFKAVGETKAGPVWQPVKEEAFASFLENIADFLYGFQSTDPVLPSQFQIYFFTRDLDVTYDPDVITVVFAGKANFFDRKRGEVRDEKGELVDLEDERQESIPLLATLPQILNPETSEETFSRLKALKGNYRAFLMNAFPSASDGGKKTPRAARRLTDEEAGVAYLYTKFDSLHSKMDSVTTLLQRIKEGKISETEKETTELEFIRLLESLRSLAREFPETLPPETDFKTLQETNKRLKQETQTLYREIVKAYGKKDDERLTELNAAITPKLWLRAWVEAELAYRFLTEKKNPSAALALLLGTRNRMANLQIEYYWRRVRPYIDQKVTQLTVTDFFGFPVEITYVGEYDIRQSPKGEVTVIQRRWKNRLVPLGDKMETVRVLEDTPIKFKDMPTAIRSGVHALFAEEKAYGGILHAQSNFQHIIFRIEQEKQKREPMPQKEFLTALEITHKWIRRGIANDLRLRARPDVEEANTYLEKELYDDALNALRRAKQELGKALGLLDGRREGIRKRTLLLLHEWRNYEDNKQKLLEGIGNVVTLLEAGKPLEAVTELLILRSRIFRGRPHLKELQQVYDRFEPTLQLLRNASGLSEKKDKTLQDESDIISFSQSAEKNLTLMLTDLGAKGPESTAPDGADRQVRPLLQEIRRFEPALLSP